jgi:hypothetical protein
MPALLDTATGTLPARGDAPPVDYSWTPGLLAGCGVLTLSATKPKRFAVTYAVVELPTDRGRAFRLEKIPGAHGDDAEALNYDVTCDGPYSACECKGFLRWRRCRHVEAVTLLVNERGL